MELETAFERRRGVGSPSSQAGFAQVRITELEQNSRQACLRALADLGLRLHFLKLAANGMSFLIAGEDSPAVQKALTQFQANVHLASGRWIVTIPAVNIRDEDGLIAGLVATAIRSGTQIDHLGDMHDRLVVVTDEPGSKLLIEAVTREHCGAAL